MLTALSHCTPSPRCAIGFPELRNKDEVIVEMRGGTQTHLKKPLDGAVKVTCVCMTCALLPVVSPRMHSNSHNRRAHDTPSQMFNFDHSFWSTHVDDSHFANQQQVFDAVGDDVLSNIFEGYNVSPLGSTILSPPSLFTCN
jgi:hypothetical protein